MTRFRDHWHAVALSREVAARPLRRRLFGAPLVLWRAHDELAALVDVCPHRGAPLSGGVCRDGQVTCPYHGYAFDRHGRCVHTPITGEAAPLSAQALPVLERDGIVWTSFGAPAGEPPALAVQADWAQITLTRAFDAPFELVVENFMDSGHTGLVHRGLIRGSGRVTRAVTAERSGSSVVVTHHPAPEQIGVLRRWYGESSTRHTDRFTLPATVRVDYDLGGGRAFAALLYVSPTTEETCTVFAAVAVRLGALNPVARLVVAALGREVLRQDVAITRAVAENLRQTDARPGFAPSDVMHRLVAELIAAGGALPPERHELTLRL